jgi:hypothetical protein
VRRRVAVVGAAGVLVLATGCSSGQPGDLTAAAEKVLAPKVQQVRDVAATGTYPQLERVVNQLKRLVDSERADGQVSDGRANAIKDAADTLLTDAQPTSSPSPTPSQSSSSPTASSTPTPPPSSTPSSTPAPSSSESSSPGTSITIGGSPP